MTSSFFDAVAAPRIVGFMILLPDPIPIPQKATWFAPVDERVPELDGLVQVPVPDGDPVHFEQEAKNFVSLRFWQMTDDRPLPFAHDTDLLFKAFTAMRPATDEDDAAGELKTVDEIDVGERYRTVVEAVTFNSEEPSDTSPADRCLDALLKFHRAYRMTTPQPLPELTLKRLFPTALVFARRLEETEVTTVGTMIFEQTVPDIGALVSDIQPAMFDQVSAMQRRLDRHDPMARYYESRTDAKHALHGIGSYRDAVVHLGISCEVLFDGLLGILMWEEGMSVDDAAAVFSKNITPRIKTEFHTRLKGTWKLDRGELGGWSTKVADIRNRVVHSGYTPTEQEAHEAEKAADELRDFTARQIAAAGKTYPFTGVTFLGEVEYPNVPSINKAARAWLTANRNTLDEKSDQHREWREKVNAAIARSR